MTDNSKTPAAEELNTDDLDKVQGGYQKIEVTVRKDSGEARLRKEQGSAWNIEQGSAWKVEEGEALKDAKDSGTKG